MENNLKYDVVIIGGGTSGCSCAYTCSKNGLKTLLVEKNNFLGGLMTGGLVVPIMKSSVEDLNCEYYKKLVATAKKFGSQITYKDKNDGWLNPEILKIVLDDVLNFSNLDILFETTVNKVEIDRKNVKKIILNSNLLSLPVEAKYFVDATGSAEFSKMCGCDFLYENNEKQKNSLRFILGNVDVEKFVSFITSYDDNEDITNTYRDELDTCNQIHFTTASTWNEDRYWAVDNLLKDGVKKGLLNDSDRAYFQIFSVAGATGQVAFNCPRMENYQNNPFMHSRELMNARRAIYRLYEFAKSMLPGFENSIIVNIATQTGIREENRVKSKYVFNYNDLITSKGFDTPVLKANYAVDIHSDSNKCTSVKKLVSYELPIKSLMSYNIDNMFIIGKIVGADFVSHSALRVQKSCMSMGEGVANYILNLK